MSSSKAKRPTFLWKYGKQFPKAAKDAASFVTGENGRCGVVFMGLMIERRRPMGKEEVAGCGEGEALRVLGPCVKLSYAV